MTRLLPTLLLALLVPAALAQTGIVADPNPFVGATDSTLVLRNARTEPVSLDSLRFTSSYNYLNGSGPENVHGWVLHFYGNVGGETREGVVTCSRIPSLPCESRAPVTFDPIGATLAPGDSVVFDSFEFYCAICRGPNGPSSMGGVNDTLLVYSGGDPDPLRAVLLDAGFSVSSESAPTAPAARVDVYPNPARGPVTVRLDVETASELEAVVYDATGRLVGASRRGAYGPGTAVVPVDVGGLPPGPYVVEVRGRLATGAPVRRAGTFVVVE